jgi:hypothetical protein
MKKAIIYIVFTIVLVTAGILTGQKFMNISISELNLNNVSFAWTTISGQFNQILFYSLAIGLIPILHLLTSKISKPISYRQNLIILGIIITVGIVFWQFRIFQLNRYFEEFANTRMVEGIKCNYYAEDFRFDFYLALGFIVGTVISTIIFRQVNSEKNKE